MSVSVILCDSCGKATEDPQRCSRCKKVVYCDVSCQRAHWKTHKAGCVPPEAAQDDSARRPDSAADSLKMGTRLIAGDRENPEGYVLRAETHCSLKQFKEARIDAMKAVQLDHTNAALVHRLIKVLVQLEQHDEARKLTERALELECDKSLRVELQAMRAELENWALPLSSMNLREVEDRFPAELQRLQQLQEDEMEIPRSPQVLSTPTSIFSALVYDILRHFFPSNVDVNRLCNAFATNILAVKYSPHVLAIRKQMLPEIVEIMRSSPPPEMARMWRYFLDAFEIEKRYTRHFASGYVLHTAFVANTFASALVQPFSTPQMENAVTNSLKGLDDIADHIYDRQIRKQFIAEWKEMLAGVKGAEHWRV